MAGLLRVSEAAAIALHAMCLLGGYRDRLLTTAEIASMLDVSGTHLSKVMQKCVRARIAISVRGPGGGFRIARDPSKITLLDVFEAIEVFKDGSRCLLSNPRCEDDDCLFSSISNKVNDMIKGFLASTRVSDVRTVEGKLMLLTQTKK